MSDEITQAQEQLGKALERAQMGEDKALASLIRDVGLRFVNIFTGLLRMTKVHDLKNNAFDKPVEEFTAAQQKLFEILGAIHLIAVEDQIYINDIRMRLDMRDGGDGLGKLLLRHGVGGVSWHKVLEDAEVRSLTFALAQDPPEVAPRRHLREALIKLGVDSMDIFGVFRFRMAGEEKQQVERSAVQIMSRSTAAVSEAFNNLGGGRMPNPLPLRRAVTEILSSGVTAEGLWDAPGEATKHGRHSVRVCRYSLLIGEKIGLNESQLQDLGVAAIFHDVGYAHREGAKPAKGGQPAEPGYAPPFERHPAAGARMLMKQRGFHEAKIYRALGVLQHHRDYDDERGRPHMFARIIRIAEDFDNLSRSDKSRYCPALALAQMSTRRGTYYDPILLQAFINAVGKYPPGTLLELEDKRWVRSRSVTRSPETFAKPIAFVVRTADGAHPEVQAILDLAWEGRVRKVVYEA